MVAYPAMLGRGYQKKFILGLLACGGTLGILIPPSIPLIIFGAVTEESIGKLFIAGIIPGLVLTSILIAYAVERRCGHSRRRMVRPRDVGKVRAGVEHHHEAADDGAR